VTFVMNNIARLKRDQGDLDGALAEARQLITMIESQRISIASSDLRASYFAVAYPHYELYVDLLMLKHEEQPDAGFDAVAFEQSEKGRARSLTEMLSEGGANVREGVDPQLIKTERDLHLLLDAKANQQMLLLNGRYAARKGAALARTRQERAGAAKSISQLEVELAALEQEVDDTRRQLQGVEADIKRMNPKYSALKVPTGLSLDAVQRQVLDSDTLALEYSLGDERSYLWLIGNDFFRTFILPGRAQIERTAAPLLEELSRDPREPDAEKRSDPRSKSDRARSQSSGPARFLDLARQLSKLVLPSALTELGIANKRLIIVPDGALQFVPFAVLLNPAREGFLFEQHEIISLPSLSALAELRTDTAQRARAPGLLAIFADPVFEADDPRITGSTDKAAATPAPKTRSRGSGIAARLGLQPKLGRSGAMRGFFDLLGTGGDAGFHRLLYAHYEADSIEAIAAGQDVKSMRGLDANKNVATTMDLSGYRIIHFATHSLLDFRHPELSCIVLSQRDANRLEQDGFLRLNDIYNMKLAADLVVLSACQTAVGRDVRGEGLASLTRGFMYAGAARVVASLWKIDDEASKELMARFYDHMLGADHMSAAGALREAQLEIMKEQRWDHPYFWAAFVLQGEWR
jgi:CHAT domain-containing protein